MEQYRCHCGVSTARILHSRSDIYHIKLQYPVSFTHLHIHILTDAVAFLNSHFGASSGTRTVYLDEVECTGRETNLTDCRRSSTISCSSLHSYAGVRCQGLEDIAIDLMVVLKYI